MTGEKFSIKILILNIRTLCALCKSEVYLLLLFHKLSSTTILVDCGLLPLVHEQLFDHFFSFALADTPKYGQGDYEDDKQSQIHNHCSVETASNEYDC